MPTDRTIRGRLLVATPPLDDPNFDRSVVFMLEHSADGALGVVLNRFDDTFGRLVDLPEAPPALDLWQSRLSPPARLHSGGPVGGDSLIALAEAHRSDRPAWHLGDRAVSTLDLLHDSTGPGEPGIALRVFRGYSGWSPGQLEGEIDAGTWLVVEADFDDVFSATPAQLWRHVMRRQGGTTAWLADAPDDLSAN